MERISTHLDSDFIFIEFFKLVFKLFIQGCKHMLSSNAKSLFGWWTITQLQKIEKKSLFQIL